MSELHNRDTPETAARRRAMAVLAAADTPALAAGLGHLGAVRYTELRAPETGLVMLRGRVGGDGAPFNAGEATVTRAAIRLDSGETGFSYVLGRDAAKARLAALCDALIQSAKHRDDVERHVLAPLRHMQQQSRATAQAQTAATRVDFFTMVRGED